MPSLLDPNYLSSKKNLPYSPSSKTLSSVVAGKKAEEFLAKPWYKQLLSKEYKEYAEPGLQSAGRVAKMIQEGIAQSGGSVGLHLMGKERLTSEELSPETKWLKEIVFGKEDVKSIGTRVAETEATLKEGGLNIPGLGNIAKGLETPLAFVGVLGTIGIDFTGFGGGKTEVIKTLTKTKSIAETSNILKKINVAEDLVKEYAPIIAKMDKVEDINKILDHVSDLQKTTKTTKPINQAVKGVEPLAQETRAEIDSFQKALKDEIVEGITSTYKKQKNIIRKQIGFQRYTKNLPGNVLARLKKNFGITEWKNADQDQLENILKEVNNLQKGDVYLTDKQLEGLDYYIRSGTFGEKEANLLTKREVLGKLKEPEDIMEGKLVGKIQNELFPTVDIKEGHPIIKRIVNQADTLLEQARHNVETTANKFDKLITGAEKSRPLSISEKIKRGLVPQNKEIFQALSGSNIKLTEAETKVVEETKTLFKNIREDLGLTKYRKNYVTHLEKPLMEKLVTQGLRATVADIFKLRKTDTIPLDIMLELDNIIGSEKFFKFALARTGGVNPTTNLRRIIQEYDSLYETKKALDSILPEGQMAVNLLLGRNSAVWTKKFLQNLKGRALDSNFRNGKSGWLSKIADGIIDIGYVKLLALNWTSALKNLVAGEANSFIYQSFSKYLLGKQRLITNPKKVFTMSKEAGILEGTFADYSQRGIGKLKKIQDYLMVGQKGGEYEIRGSLFASELTEAEWKSGTISAERINDIKNVVAITQGIFSKTSTPLWMQTWWGRGVMQMNRWRVTNAMMFRRVANGTVAEIKAGKLNGINSQRLGKMFVMYGIGMYLNYELGKAGYEKAGKVAQSMAESLNSVIQLVTLKPIVDAITNNPSISTLKEFAFTIQELASYIGVPGVEKPSEIQFQKGIEETYIAPVAATKQLLGIEEETTGGATGGSLPSLNKYKKKKYTPGSGSLIK